MIIKTETAIVDTNTYDSFFIEYCESRGNYRLLAINKYTADTIPLYTAKDKIFVADVLEDIYNRFYRADSRIDLGV